MSMKIRLANEKDIDFIYTSILEDLAEQNVGYKFQYSKISFKEIIFGKNPIAIFLILTINDVPAGFANYNVDYRNYTVNLGPTLYLNDLYVQKEYRKLGGATLLCRELEKIAKQKKYKRIEGVVQKDNATAMAVYQKIAGIKIKDSLHYMRFEIDE